MHAKLLVSSCFFPVPFGFDWRLSPLELLFVSFRSLWAPLMIFSIFLFVSKSKMFTGWLWFSGTWLRALVVFLNSSLFLDFVDETRHLFGDSMGCLPLKSILLEWLSLFWKLVTLLV